MLFNSFLFLGFFTALVVVYYLVPHRARWPLLLAASLYFYSTFNPAYLLLLAGATLVAYLVALALGATEEPRRRKGILAAGVAAELGALFIFKYYGFFHGSLSTLRSGSRSTPSRASATWWTCTVATWHPSATSARSRST
jgi:D-alanyl-lipoteichoic acid acyltransferase DltB (MBOAT superfamily)